MLCCNKNFFVLTIFVLYFSFSVNSFAQLEGVMQLKKSVKTINEIYNIIRPGDPWTMADIITPEELNSDISKNSKADFIIYHIGFEVLYKQGHIKNSIFAGPASTVKGIKNLKNRVQNVSRDKEIVIYCGCCGWSDCPNIHPAFLELNKMGFKNVKILYLPNNFTKDWVDKGYPVVK